MIESQRIQEKNGQDGKVIRSKKDSYKEIASTWHIQSPLHIVSPEITPLVAQCCSWGMEAAYDVYMWLSTLKWPNDPNPKQGDCGITFLEMFVNFRLVTGKSLPITLHRKGTRVTWADFESKQAIIQSKRARSAVAQAVTLEYIIQQLSKFLKTKFIPFAKKTGIKTLSHFGHCFLQKRTGYVVRPQLTFARETVRMIDAFLTDCRNLHNYNLHFDPKKYSDILPQPLHYEIPFAVEHLNPEQVVYRRKFLHKKK